MLTLRTLATIAFLLGFVLGLGDYVAAIRAQQELYIVSGGDGLSTTIASGKVTVQLDTWKVLLVLPEDADDLSRINTTTQVIAVRMPNQNGIRSAAWESCRVTVDSLEATTGYDFTWTCRPRSRLCWRAGWTRPQPWRSCPPRWA